MAIRGMAGFALDHHGFAGRVVSISCGAPPQETGSSCAEMTRTCVAAPAVAFAVGSAPCAPTLAPASVFRSAAQAPRTRRGRQPPPRPFWVLWKDDQDYGQPAKVIVVEYPGPFRTLRCDRGCHSSKCPTGQLPPTVPALPTGHRQCFHSQVPSRSNSVTRIPTFSAF